MQVRKLNFFLVVVLIAMLSGGTVLAQGQGVPVDIPGTGVNFFLYRYEGQDEPYDKINEIWANLSIVFSEWEKDGQKPGALSAEDVQIKANASGSVSLYVKDQFILEVDEYHARANKATPAQLAEKWAANLREGIDAFVTINELK